MHKIEGRIIFFLKYYSLLKIDNEHFPLINKTPLDSASTCKTNKLGALIQTCHDLK